MAATVPPKILAYCRPDVAHLHRLVSRNASPGERRRVERVDPCWHLRREGGLGQEVIGVAAVDRVAGVALLQAERLPAAQAVPAAAARVPEPVDRDHLADIQAPSRRRRARARSRRPRAWGQTAGRASRAESMRRTRVAGGAGLAVIPAALSYRLLLRRRCLTWAHRPTRSAGSFPAMISATGTVAPAPSPIWEPCSTSRRTRGKGPAECGPLHLLFCHVAG